jgi:hypothetical protein
VGIKKLILNIFCSQNTETKNILGKGIHASLRLDSPEVPK